MRGLLTCSVALLFLLFAVSQPVEAQDTALRGTLQGLLKEFQQTYGFPGATAAVVLADGHSESVAIGLADVEAAIAMTPESRMLGASIGKTIWGALILSLETDGALSRADLVSKHLGDLPWFARLANADSMTVARLVTHSAGLRDHIHMEGVASALIARGPKAPFDPSMAISFILDEPAIFEPGSSWAYTDTGYLLLGMVIEAATGENVFDLARTYFLTPLRLDSTGPSNTTNLAGLAVGYTAKNNPFDLSVRTMDDHGGLIWNPAIEWTGGGFASTSADLAKWGMSFSQVRRWQMTTSTAFSTVYLSIRMKPLFFMAVVLRSTKKRHSVLFTGMAAGYPAMFRTCDTIAIMA